MKGIDGTVMDLGVSPKQDFYQFCNGKWLEQNPIPEEYPRWGVFHILRDQVLDQLHTLLKESNNEKLSSFWKAAMHPSCDQDEPLHELLLKVDEIETPQQWSSFVGLAHSKGIGMLCSIGVEPDLKDSTTVRAAI